MTIDHVEDRHRAFDKAPRQGRTGHFEARSSIPQTREPDVSEDAPKEQELDKSGLADAQEQDPSLVPIIKQTLLAVVVLFLVVGLLAYFFKEPLTDWATWMVTTFGLWGLVAVVPLSDVFSLPVPPEVALFIAMATDQPVALTIALLGAASVACGTISFFVGPLLARIGFVARRIEGWRSRGEALFRHWGVWTVAIGAISPVPYAMTCWFAGIYKMKYSRFFLATLFRIPRFIAYYYLFELGWIAGPS